MQAFPDSFVWPGDSCGLKLEEKLTRDLLDSFCSSGKLRAFSPLLALNTGMAICSFSKHSATIMQEGQRMVQTKALIPVTH